MNDSEFERFALEYVQEVWHPSSWSVNHVWSKPEPISINFSGKSICFMQTCPVCGSKRKRTASFNAEYWIVFEAIINHPVGYKNSKCYKRYFSRFRLSTNIKTEDWDRLRRQDQKKRELALQRLIQRRKNKAILKKFDGQVTLNNVDSLRRDLAIYRLYKYFDLTPKEISLCCELSLAQIKNIIGNIFSALCVSYDSCVFREPLETTTK